VADPTDKSSDQQAAEERRKRREELLALLFLLLPFDDDTIAAGRAMWSSHAPPAYRGLIDGADQYRFDPQRQLYVRTDTDRVIPAAELKRVSVTYSLGIARDVLEPDAMEMAQHQNAIERWVEDMAGDVRSLAVGEAALALGGFDRIGNDAISRLIGADDEAPGLKFTLSKLAGFAADIEAHASRADSPAAIVNRAGLYARAQNAVFEDQRRQSHMDVRDGSGRALHLYERNILGNTEDHCVRGKFTQACVDVTAAGWQPIGSLPLPGLRTCGGNCLCHMEFSLTGPAAPR
jgi:hypothetical protein